MAFNWGDTVNSPGNWEDSEEIRRLMAEQGTDYGDWKVDPATGIKYIDTPRGRVQNSNQLLYNPNVEAGSSAYVDPNKTVGLIGGRHANENGSDAIRGRIDENGVLGNVRMDRESNADRNIALAGILGIGAAAALGAGGAAAAGAGGGTSAGAGATGSFGAAEAAGGSGLVSGGGVAGGAAGGTGLTMGGAGSAAGMGGGSGLTMAGAGGGTLGGSSLASSSGFFSSLFGMSTGTAQLAGGIISGIGQAYNQRQQSGDARAMQSERIAAEERMLERQYALRAQEAQTDREWKARNFTPGFMPTVTWHG